MKTGKEIGCIDKLRNASDASNYWKLGEAGRTPYSMAQPTP